MGVTQFQRILGALTESDPVASAKSCPWFKDGFCKMDGRPCPYMEETYTECSKFRMSQTHPDAAQALADKFSEAHKDSGGIRG